MKKSIIAIALFAGMTMTASALSFNWAATGTSFDGSVLKKSSDITGYLVFLGTGGSYDASYALSESTTASSLASSIGTLVQTSTGATSNAGKLQTTFTFDFGAYNNGDVFGMLLEYKGASDGKTYYNLSSDTYTLAGISDEGSVLDNAVMSFSYSTAGEKSSITKGGGWTAVPEPSTAALALAGLALLLKRRKA